MAVAGSLVDEGYGDMHRLVLQGMMSAGYLDAKGVKNIFVEACHSLKYTTDERTSMPYVQKVVREINDRIKPFDMAIRSASDELSGKKYYVFLVTVEKPIMQHQSMFSKQELKLFHKIMDTCLRKYRTFSVPLIECQNMPIEMEMKNFSLSQAEEFIQRMITLLYLTPFSRPGAKKGDKGKDPKDSGKKKEHDQRDFDITIGIRTIREFEPILRESYEDVITSCQLCKYIMIHGYQCPKCKTNIHKACFLKYITNTKNCVNSNCRITWREKDMVRRARDGDGDDGEVENPSSPIPSTSAAARKKNSQRQDITEDDTLEDMPVLETMVSPPPSQTKGKGKKSPPKSKSKSKSPPKNTKKKGRATRKLSSTEEDSTEEEDSD